ncbi:MAG: acyltransferase [Patescibacteria group bacterium]
MSQKSTSQKIVNRLKTIFEELIVYKLHISGCVPFHHYRRFVYRLCGMTIGTGSSIHMHLTMFAPWGIIIGKDSIIGEKSTIDGRGKVIIGDHVDIASEVMIYTSEHMVNDKDFKAHIAQVKIGDYVFVGPRAIILPGVTIGKGAVIGAGAVVTKDVGEFEIVGGVPAKTIGYRDNKEPSYKLGRAAWFR